MKLHLIVFEVKYGFKIISLIELIFFIKWLLEITEYTENIPIIIIGTHVDLVNNTTDALQNNFQWQVALKGLELVNTTQARKYIECSKFDKNSLDKLFQLIIKLVVFKIIN